MKYPTFKVEDVPAPKDVLALSVSSGTIGVPLDPDTDPDKWLRWIRRRRFGRRVWAGRATCSTCGEALPPLDFEERGSLMLEPAGPVGPGLRRLCPRCGIGSRSGALLDARAAHHTLRRALAYENHAGARWPTVGDAVALMDEAGSPPALLERMARQRLVLGRFPLRMSLALEIALTDEDERQLLQLDVVALEARWREEEALAAIVDGELTPLPPRRG